MGKWSANEGYGTSWVSHIQFYRQARNEMATSRFPRLAREIEAPAKVELHACTKAARTGEAWANRATAPRRVSQLVIVIPEHLPSDLRFRGTSVPLFLFAITCHDVFHTTSQAAMSLFDDDDLPSRPKQSGSLFDDDPKPSGKGLFSDDFHGGDDSPWAFPTPKKPARGSLVKSLLPASDVPDSYIDAFDSLLELGERVGNGLSIQEIKKLLEGSGLPSDTQSKILEVVSQPDQDTNGLGRNEFNVLFALIGLAQEGDDVTLDSVDERKKSELRAQIVRSYR